MHPRATAFVECAREEYEFEPTVEEFPEGTKTAADAAEAIGCDVAQIASSLAFEADGDMIVSVTSGAHRADEATLAEHVGVSPDALEMADPERIKAHLGWSIGGVPPFCHETPTPTFLDRTLLEFDTVWAAAGTPTAVFPIEPSLLQKLADADVVRVAASE